MGSGFAVWRDGCSAGLRLIQRRFLGLAPATPDGDHGDGGGQDAETDQKIVHLSPPRHQPLPNRLKARLARESPTATGTAKTMTRRNAAAVFMKDKRRAAPPSSPRASDIPGATDSRCSR